MHSIEIDFLFGITAYHVPVNSGQKNIPWCGAEVSFPLQTYSLHCILCRYLCSFLKSSFFAREISIVLLTTPPFHRCILQILCRDWLSQVPCPYVDIRNRELPMILGPLFSKGPTPPFAPRSHGSAGECKVALVADIPAHYKMPPHLSAEGERGHKPPTKKKTANRDRSRGTGLDWGH